MSGPSLLALEPLELLYLDHLFFYIALVFYLHLYLVYPAVLARSGRPGSIKARS
jgi:hypothetical protein